MKTIIVPVLSLLSLLSAKANTYYSTNYSIPSSVLSWHSNRNGTGSIPGNFNSAGDIFIIQTGHTVNTTANWNIGGNNSKIIVETGAILQANQKITVDIFEVDGTGKYIHNDNSSAFPGSNDIILSTTSTVEIDDWNGSAKLPANVNWGNLIIDMGSYTSNMKQAGDLNSIAGNFTIRSTGSGKEFQLAAGQDYTLTIGGDLIIEGGILEASSNNNANADQLIIINGSYIQTGGEFVRSNSNSNVLQVQFNGANSQFTKTGGTLTNDYINWQVNTSKKLTLNNDLPISASRSMTVAGTLNLGARSLTGTGSFIVNSTGSLVSTHASGLGGNLSLTGGATFTSGASYEFDAATVTPFPSALASVVATNLVIGADVTINKNMTISGSFTLSNGRATIPVNNTVTISSGNAITGSGFGSTKHIVTQVNTSTGAKGYLRVQNYTGTATMPVGTGTYYLPVILTAPGTNDFSICVFNGVTSTGQPNGTAFTSTQKKTVVDAVWQVNRNSGSGGVTMQLQWPSALEGSLFQNVVDNQIGIAHYGTYWEVALGTGSQSSNTATRTNITSFSPFGVGYAGVILPLRFGDIKASQAGTGVKIDWFTYSEHSFDHYEVERSTEGKNFSKITNMAAAGNTSVITNYSYTDPIAMNGTLFYRVKGVDVDGKLFYSGIVRINLGEQQQAGMRLYPNPVMDKRISVEVTGLAKGHCELQIVDGSGQLVYRKTMDYAGGAMNEQLQLPASIAAGIYRLSVTDNKQVKLVSTFVAE